jgi:addiction module HigA family antidote
MARKQLEPIHPGEILAQEFMAPYGLSANALARSLGVPVTRISEVIRGRRGISADSALRLARFFGTTPDLWLGLQAEYDLRVVERRAGAEIRRVPPPQPGPGGELRLVVRSRRNDAVEVREPLAEYGGRGGGPRA